MSDLISEVVRLKKETGTLVLAHTYQPPEIIDAADITGDSFALAKACLNTDAKRVIVCGVRFMAEGVKILSPEKEVILPSPEATCPMAEMITPERVREYKKAHPQAVVVAYINTTAALKAECDICVTSSSALKIIASVDAEILFIPDKNLGGYVSSQFPDKNITVWDGYCPVHNSLTAEDVLKAKAEHPDALLAVHPECVKEVVALADMVGSTADIIKFANSTDKPVIIGTERGVADHMLRSERKNAVYMLAPEKLTCRDMKYTDLAVLAAALRGEAGESIQIDEGLRIKAKKCIDEMLKRG